MMECCKDDLNNWLNALCNGHLLSFVPVREMAN